MEFWDLASAEIWGAQYKVDLHVLGRKCQTSRHTQLSVVWAIAVQIFLVTQEMLLDFCSAIHSFDAAAYVKLLVVVRTHKTARCADCVAVPSTLETTDC